jgi:hypothetical protein
MNNYRITYKNGAELIVKANTALEVIKKYDLSTKENISTILSIMDKGVTK